MEHFNDILFHMSGPANKQYTNQPMNIIQGLGPWSVPLQDGSCSLHRFIINPEPVLVSLKFSSL
jgi:hypothetical protein